MNITDTPLVSRAVSQRTHEESKFNPLPPIDPEKAFDADLDLCLSPLALRVAADVLGRERVEFWMNDFRDQYLGEGVDFDIVFG